MCITEKQLDLLERAYADQSLHLDGPQVLRLDAATLENLLEAGLIEPTTSSTHGSYVLTDLGRFVLRRRYLKAQSSDLFTAIRRNLPLIDVDHFE
ncbi:hypothetical protein [Methylococcus mesophilus]|uniref:hypothetical protein n=1 Tax=Methylococcus mesophilus TaxID=2993564 RepID=UPI00224B768A|nr:hypothetical protein [Methylococcus mesophilus]UZR30627.1 hypothetical protein OOT43_08335 [Methylococcus mesophilus]